MVRPIRSYVKWAIGIAILLAATAWVADWLLLAYRKDTGFGQVEIHRRFAVHLKNRQIQQRVEKPYLENCVNSLFPHYQESPCWYLARHANDVEDLDGTPWHFWNDDRP